MFRELLNYFIFLSGQCKVCLVVSFLSYCTSHLNVNIKIITLQLAHIRVPWYSTTSWDFRDFELFRGWKETQRSHFIQLKITDFSTGKVNETYVFCIMKQMTNWANWSINELPVKRECRRMSKEQKESLWS